MKFSFALGIAAVLGASAALAQDFQTAGGDVGPPDFPSRGYPPPDARPLDPPGGGAVDSGGQVSGPPLGPDNQFVPLQPSPAPYANHPTVPTVPAIPTVPAVPIVTADGGWIAGAGIEILEPRWGNNPAYGQVVASSNSTSTQTLQTTTQADFNMGVAAAPLLWLGYVGENGVGVRARGSMFYDKDTLSLNCLPQTNSTTTIYSASPAGVGGFSSANVSPSNSNAFVFNSDLTMQVADLEILWDLHSGSRLAALRGGVRYAYLAQNYNATWKNSASRLWTATKDALSTTLTSQHNFTGLGPVASVEAAYPLGQTGFRLIGMPAARSCSAREHNGRPLHLGHQRLLWIPAPPDAPKHSQSAGVLMPVLEFELGADWGHTLVAYRFAISTALVGQVWFYGGNASNSDNVFGLLVLATSPDHPGQSRTDRRSDW